MMNHKGLLVAIAFVGVTICGPGAARGERTELVAVARITGVQPTGIAVSKRGRIFINFPRWRAGVPFSVAELADDGSFLPYPDSTWNAWTPGGDPKRQFICVQSVIVDQADHLWVLDPASPGLAGVVAGGVKAVRFRLASDDWVQTAIFDSMAAPQRSYLNDVRVDDQAAYITCSGTGAIVVADLVSGESARRLEDHPSAHAEDIVLSILGRPLRLTNGIAPRIHSDGIALDRRNGYLYYHALTGYHLYRIPTSRLLEAGITDDALAAYVEDLGETPAPDGMIFDNAGNLLMADLENRAIVYRAADGEIRTLVRDDRLRWVDSFSLGPDGCLYFTCSRIDETEWFVEGADVSNLEFEIYKVDISKLGESDAIRTQK